MNMMDNPYYNLTQTKKKAYTNHQQLDSMKINNPSTRHYYIVINYCSLG